MSVVRDGAPSPALASPDGDGATVDFSRYIPTVLSRLVSRLRVNANAFFKERYGINLFEWRVVAALAGEGPMTAYALWTEGGLDKAAVSRALRDLETRGFVLIEADESRGRRRRTRVSLTREGQRLHSATMSDVAARHARLVAGIPQVDLETLVRVAGQLDMRIADMADNSVPADPSVYRITRD